MKISIITTIGNEKQTPDERGDRWIQAINCYLDLADEVIVINGGSSLTPLELEAYSNVKVVHLAWPYEWSWDELPKHLNAGLEAATGDWVLKLDIDQLVHEEDFLRIRQTLELYKDSPILTFEKRSFTKWNRYYQKGKMPVAINKRILGDTVRFGDDPNKRTDLCYPIIWNGKYNDKGVPLGTYDILQHTGVSIPIYNYDYTFKTEKQTKDEFWRFAKAYQRYFGEWKFGATKEEAFKKFMDMMEGRKMNVYYDCRLEQHPKYIQQALKDLKPEQFGYNGFGIFK